MTLAEQLSAQLIAIEAERQALLAELTSWPEPAQTWRPTPEAWSARDVIEHLARAEAVVLGDLVDARARPDAPIRPVERVRRVLVWFVLRAGVRVRAPSRRMLPTGEGSLATWRAAWDTQRAALARYLESSDAATLTRRVFRHPVAGPLNAAEAVRLLAAHQGTHARQLARLAAERRTAAGRSPPPDLSVRSGDEGPA